MSGEELIQRLVEIKLKTKDQEVHEYVDCLIADLFMYKNFTLWNTKQKVDPGVCTKLY